MSNRRKLQLDEQSFQGLLAAAYTIQEHADVLKQVSKAGRKVAQELGAEVPSVCRNCAAPLTEGESRCGRCGWEEFRPGERTQRKLAALWAMSQQHSVRQEHPRERSEESVQELARSGLAVLPEAAHQSAETGATHQAAPLIETNGEADLPIEVERTVRSGPVATTEDNGLTEANSRSVGPWNALLDFRQQLSHHRANLYLGLSVLVALLALLWPAPASPHRPRLDPWQRVLVELGIADAPAPQIHYRGDPNIQVWVDPHTALYYCPGDEPYGKAPDGHLTSQRDAQADQFEPAYRAACN